jgi:hypothetical protein
MEPDRAGGSRQERKKKKGGLSSERPAFGVIGFSGLGSIRQPRCGYFFGKKARLAAGLPQRRPAM